MSLSWRKWKCGPYGYLTVFALQCCYREVVAARVSVGWDELFFLSNTFCHLAGPYLLSLSPSVSVTATPRHASRLERPAAVIRRQTAGELFFNDADVPTSLPSLPISYYLHLPFPLSSFPLPLPSPISLSLPPAFLSTSPFLSRFPIPLPPPPLPPVPRMSTSQHRSAED